MLGEEMWIAERPLDRAMVVNEAASMFGIGGVLGSLKGRPLPTVLCTVFEVALLPNTGLNNPLIEANLLNVASRPRCWGISRTGSMAP